jgi:hypothetical protein
MSGWSSDSSTLPISWSMCQVNHVMCRVDKLIHVFSWSACLFAWIFNWSICLVSQLSHMFTGRSSHPWPSWSANPCPWLISGSTCLVGQLFHIFTGRDHLINVPNWSAYPCTWLIIWSRCLVGQLFHTFTCRDHVIHVPSWSADPCPWLISWSMCLVDQPIYAFGWSADPWVRSFSASGCRITAVWKPSRMLTHPAGSAAHKANEICRKRKREREWEWEGRQWKNWWSSSAGPRPKLLSSRQLVA